MKFLDERIIFDISIGASASDLPEKGVYTYSIYVENIYSSTGYDTIFVGNFFYNKTLTLTLDVTDIIRNSAGNHLNIANALHNPSALTPLFKPFDSNMISEYWIVLTMNLNGTTITKESTHLLVAKAYRYPNRSAYTMFDGSLQFINYNLLANEDSYNSLIQGLKYIRYSEGDWDRFTLVPRYPVSNADNLAFGVTFGFGSNVSSINLLLLDETLVYNAGYNISTASQGLLKYNGTWLLSLSSVILSYINYIIIHSMAASDLKLYYKNSDNKNVLIAIFETCNSRYYLQWLDRFGNIQCLPFRDNITYSENFSRDEIITYDDKRHLSNISILPQWKLYSGWIGNELFPLYESLYISPFLILYDAYTDTNYEVIVNDKYTEKNYKNLKSLVNIELTLEAAEKQNILLY